MSRLLSLFATLSALLACAAGPAATPAAAGVAAIDPVGVWPLRPTPAVVGDFDPPDSRYGAGHRGVDLAGTVGQPVHAALAGEVVYAGMLAGRGVVVVSHGTTRTTYEPVAASVVVGDAVRRGAVIGALGLTQSHCFPRACLHWGWRDGARYLDPLRLVGAGPVRLLPLWRDQPVDRWSPHVAAPPRARALPADVWREAWRAFVR